MPAVQAPLLAEAGRMAAELQQAVLDEVPAFTDSGNPDVIPELSEHLDAHVREVCRLLGGGLPGELDFVREHAERRASQRFPLDALLQSYRILHRTLATWVRDAALEVADESAHLRRVVAAVTDFVIEYTGNAGSLLTSEYVHHTRRLAEAEADRRSALLNTLLDGYDEADQTAAGLLRRAGYLQQRQSYCVAIARSVDPARDGKRAAGPAHGRCRRPRRSRLSSCAASSASAITTSSRSSRPRGARPGGRHRRRVSPIVCTRRSGGSALPH